MTTKRTNTRNPELAKIHIAKKQLGLDDDTYRSMLWTVARVRSAADLDHAGRQAVLDHLKSRGWTNDKRRNEPRTAANENLIAKIEAQLTEMKLPWNYAHSMALRMFKVRRLEWCSAKQLHDIVAALAYEQEKRKKLAFIDATLKKLGESREHIAAILTSRRPDYKRDWTRDLRMLRMFSTWLHVRLVRMERAAHDKELGQ